MSAIITCRHHRAQGLGKIGKYSGKKGKLSLLYTDRTNSHNNNLHLYSVQYLSPRISPPHACNRLFDPSVSSNDTSIVYSCAVLGQSLLMPLVGLLQFSLGLRGCAAVGVFLVSSATIASSQATSVTGLAVLNAVFGIGIAFA